MYGQKELANTERFNQLLDVLRTPPTAEEIQILIESAEEGNADEELLDELEFDELTADLKAELAFIENEIDKEIAAEASILPPEEEERQEQLDALVMSRARGVGALLGFAQNTIRPAWIRAKAMRELMSQEDGNDAARWAGTFPLKAFALPADAPNPVDLNGILLEKDVNETVHAECLTRKQSAGYALAMDMEEKGAQGTFGENALLHVTLFDRTSGASFKKAVARLERHGEAVFHADLFDKDTLSRADLERADALVWVESAENGSEE